MWISRGQCAQLLKNCECGFCRSTIIPLIEPIGVGVAIGIGVETAKPTSDTDSDPNPERLNISDNGLNIPHAADYSKSQREEDAVRGIIKILPGSANGQKTCWR